MKKTHREYLQYTYVAYIIRLVVVPNMAYWVWLACYVKQNLSLILGFQLLFPSRSITILSVSRYVYDTTEISNVKLQ
jgi:hypothetical protein